MRLLVAFYPDLDPESSPIVAALRERFSAEVSEFAGFRGDLSLRVPRERAIEILTFLRDDPRLRFDFLMDVAGVDWLGREPRFDVVYHLCSSVTGQRLRLKTGVPEDDPVMASAVSVWKAADWFERECYDLLGILFRGHPFLRRILTHDEFEGHPLRKDYDQRQRWRCTRVSDLEDTVAVPAATTPQATPAATGGAQ